MLACSVRRHVNAHPFAEDSYLEVALVSVEDDGLFSVVHPLHLQRQPADGRLEVGLLRVHHQTDAVLQGMLGMGIRCDHVKGVRQLFVGGCCQLHLHTRQFDTECCGCTLRAIREILNASVVEFRASETATSGVTNLFAHKKYLLLLLLLFFKSFRRNKKYCGDLLWAFVQIKYRPERC